MGVDINFYVFIEKNILFKKGRIYKQSEYYRTLFNLSKLGVWQSVNIIVTETPNKDSLLELEIELTP